MKMMRKEERYFSVYFSLQVNNILSLAMSSWPLYIDNQRVRSQDMQSLAMGWIEPTIGHTLFRFGLAQYF